MNKKRRRWQSVGVDGTATALPGDRLRATARHAGAGGGPAPPPCGHSRLRGGVLAGSPPLTLAHTHTHGHVGAGAQDPCTRLHVGYT